MKTRQTARHSDYGPVSRLHLRPLLGAALALGVAACSNDDEAAPATPLGAEAGTANTPAGMPSPGTPNEGETTQGGGTPAASPSEEQQVGGLDTPPVEASPGASGPSAAGDAGAADEGEPVATVPGGLAPAVPSAGCGKARTLQDGIQTLVSGGVDRTFLLETPDAYDAALPHRVVFMFHWNYGSINAIVNPPDADRNTDRPFYGMGDLTDDKTIFVVPQGLVSPSGGPGWENPGNRDVIFTDAMLAAISADLCIDTSRVFTTGFSYGAGMSVALACTRPDQFRAAVVYAPAFISGVQPAQCTTPVAFFESHGVDDPIINYATGLNVLNTFTGLNGCAAMTPPEPAADAHSCVSYEGCSVPTRFCNFGADEGNPFNTDLRGHYPTSKDPGQSTSWVPAEAWSFITQF
jgi:poly(3-hydroxybutyrate) depolymerase